MRKNKTKKNIIITGSSGFIGSALIEHLHKKYNIIGIDKRSPLKRLSNTDCKFYIRNINNLDLLPNCGEVYAVIHLAARAGVRNSHKDFECYCEDNILGTQKVIDKCISDWKPKKLLFASSSSVYGDSEYSGKSQRESYDTKPKSPYAMSKLAGEILLDTYRRCGMLKGINTTSLRFFTVYGPNQRNELAIRSFIDCVLKDEPIKLYGTGKQRRDFTFIDDVCDAIEVLLERDYNQSIYNIGSGKPQTINDVIYKISKYLDKNVTINYLPRDIYDVDETYACIDMMKPFWQPKVDFDEGLKRQIEWQKEKHDYMKFGVSLKDVSEALSKMMRNTKLVLI